MCAKGALVVCIKGVLKGNHEVEGLAPSSWASAGAFAGTDLVTGGEEVVDGGEPMSPAPSPDASSAASALLRG